MKVAACYIVLNEADYIKYSLDSVYDAMDQIYIVEGAIEAVADRESDNGLSIDGTTQIIESYPDPQGKIRYKHAGVFPHKVELRQVYMDMMDPEVDWIFIVDGDEAYNAENLENNLRLIGGESDLVWVGTEFDNFNGDFWHTLVKPPDLYSKPGWFFDRHGNSMVNGEYHERLFRNLPGLAYQDSHATIQDSGRIYLYSQGKYRKQRLYVPHDDFRYRWIHYGYVRDIKRIEAKLGFHGVEYHGAQSEASRGEFIHGDHRRHLMMTGELREDKVEEGWTWVHVPNYQHPEAFKQHPRYNLTREQITEQENTYL